MKNAGSTRWRAAVLNFFRGSKTCWSPNFGVSGYDVANRTLSREQPADFVHLLQLIELARLDRDLFLGNLTCVGQIFLHIVGMHDTGSALILSRSLNLNQTNRPDIHIRIRL